jgi:CheY-like chemotaxis protein
MNSKRILIVEDDSDTRLAYHILLKVKHCETYFAKDPLSCLWGAHKHRPDLIIMDIGLTAGDGFRAMAQLHTAGHLANPHHRDFGRRHKRSSRVRWRSASMRISKNRWSRRA